VAASRFIRPQHPKTEIRPDPQAIRRVLDLGWAGQLKIHGHRAQIHIPASESQAILVYNRQGQLHKKKLSPSADSELRRLFQPEEGWNVIDGEWLKERDFLFIFDFIKKDGTLLSDLSYADRFALIPRNFLSPHVKPLPLLKTLEACLDTLDKLPAYAEGLVFKSLGSPGFEDTAIVRCRVKR
jgi:hypothetical protein